MSRPNSEAEGTVRFYMEACVSAVDMANWSPERITAFFNGIAQAQEALNGEVEP